MTRNFSKGSVPIVAIKTVMAVVSEKQIFPAVIVIVADANSGRPTGIGETRSGGDIGEGSVAIVAVEAVSGTWQDAPELTAANQENIHPAIVVKVEERAATSHRLDDISYFTGCSVEDGLSETSLHSYIREAGKWRQRCRTGGGQRC